MPYQKKISKEKTIKIDNDAKNIASMARMNGQNLTLNQLISINTDIRKQKSLNIWKDLTFDRDFATFKVLNPSKNGPQISFSRGTGATQIGSTGLVEFAPENLLLRSEEYNDSAWTKSNLSVLSNQIVAPNGLLSASKLVESAGSSSKQLTQLSGTLTGRLVFSVYAKAAERRYLYLVDGNTTANRAVFDLTVGVITSTAGGPEAKMTHVGDNWYRCEIGASLSSQVFGVRVCISDSGLSAASFPVPAYNGDGTSGLYIWGAQLERYNSARKYIPTTSAEVYGARFTHNPVTLASLGLLIEESRVNSFQRSEEIGVSPWGTQTTTASQVSVTNPSGGSTSSLLTPNSGSPACHVRQQITAAASVYVCSFWIRAGTATTASFLFRDETAGSSLNCTPAVISGTASVSGGSATAQVTGLTSGWARVSFTLNSAAVSGNTLRIYIYPETSGTSTGKTVYVWGVQLEAGAFATSYIPTTSATATRAADLATMTGTNFSSWYNQSEWTAVMDYQMNRIIGPSEFPRLFTFQDSAFNSYSRIYLARVSDATSNAYGAIIVSGTNYANIGVAGFGSNTANVRAGASFSSSLLRVAQNNVAADDATVAVPTVDRLYLGSNSLGINLNGTIARFRFYQRAMPSNIQALTALAT